MLKAILNIIFPEKGKFIDCSECGYRLGELLNVLTNEYHNIKLKGCPECSSKKMSIVKIKNKGTFWRPKMIEVYRRNVDLEDT
jgi:DNA-directed RNA polymerase subunit RPC12/RpoP